MSLKPTFNRQLRKVHRNPSDLILREHLGRLSPPLGRCYNTLLVASGVQGDDNDQIRYAWAVYAEYAKRLLDVPEDREPAVRKLIEEAGGKLISYYMTTGDSDFLLISEANESEAIIAALMAFSAAGMISDVAL